MAPGRSEIGNPSISAIPGVGSAGGGDDCPATVAPPSSSNACNEGGSSATSGSSSAERGAFGAVAEARGAATTGPGAARTATMGDAARGGATGGAAGEAAGVTGMDVGAVESVAGSRGCVEGRGADGRVATGGVATGGVVRTRGADEGLGADGVVVVGSAAGVGGAVRMGGAVALGCFEAPGGVVEASGVVEAGKVGVVGGAARVGLAPGATPRSPLTASVASLDTALCCRSCQPSSDTFRKQRPSLARSMGVSSKHWAQAPRCWERASAPTSRARA